MRVTRPASEIAAALKRRVPSAVAALESQHGLRIEDVLHRRGLPEAQRFIHDIVVALHFLEWSSAEIARWLDTDQRAVDRTIAKLRTEEVAR